MTAVATVPAAARGSRGSRDLAGTGALLRLALRRDRIMIPVWVLLIGMSVVSVGSSFETLYGTAAERAGLVRSMSTNASLRALYGPVFDDSIGGLVAWRMTAFSAVLAAVMSLLIVVRHTREEEETGRQEPLSAAMVGRRAPLTAALLAALVANAALALVIGGGLARSGQPVAGSLAMGLGIAGTGMLFAGVAAIAAQFTESARLAKGLTGAVLGLAFALRAAGDAATNDGSSPLVWASPVGWAEQLRAFAGERWWVLLLTLGAIVVTAAVAYVLTARRDLGMSFLASRPGPAHAPASLSSPMGLAWRLQRATLFGWSAAYLVAGAMFGGIAEGVADLVGASERTREIFERMGGSEALTDAFLAAVAGLFGMVAAIFAVGSVLRLNGEESSYRAEPVLATAVGRIRWAGTHLLIAFLGSVIVMTAGGVGLALGYGVTVGDIGGEFLPIVTGAVAQTPAIWALAGVTVLIYGALPKIVGVVWALVGGSIAIGWIGPALDLPRWAMDLSPFTHLPKLPGAEPTADPFLWLLALAALTTVAGLAALRRRDVG